MSYRRKVLVVLMAGALVGTMGIRSAAADDEQFVVIVHPSNNVARLGYQTLADLFLKKEGTWDDGTAVEAVDQAGAAEVREAFSQVVHKRSAANVKSYWQKEIFSGGKVPPPEVASDADVVAFVREHRGGLGYVTADASLKGVRPVPLVTPPRVARTVAPSYPPMAARFKIQGDVRLRLEVDAEGRVKEATIIEGLSHGIDEEAVATVKKWRFEPAIAEGQAVPGTIDVTLTFKL